MSFLKRATSATLKFVFAGLVLVSFFGSTDASAKTRYVQPTEKVEEKLHLTVYVDDKFTPSERPAVIRGMNEWVRATNGLITMEFKSGWSYDKPFNDVPEPDETGMVKCTRSVHIARTTSETPLVKEIETEIDGEILGYANPRCREKWFIVVIGQDRINDNALLSQVTTHEMGHILGLQHIPVAKMSIMYPGGDKPAMCVTVLDLVQLCDEEFFDCDVAKLAPCIPDIPTKSTPKK